MTNSEKLLRRFLREGNRHYFKKEKSYPLRKVDAQLFQLYYESTEEVDIQIELFYDFLKNFQNAIDDLAERKLFYDFLKVVHKEIDDLDERITDNQYKKWFKNTSQCIVYVLQEKIQHYSEFINENINKTLISYSSLWIEHQLNIIQKIIATQMMIPSSWNENGNVLGISNFLSDKLKELKNKLIDLQNNIIVKSDEQIEYFRNIYYKIVNKHIETDFETFSEVMKYKKPHNGNKIRWVSRKSDAMDFAIKYKFSTKELNLCFSHEEGIFKDNNRLNRVNPFENFPIL